MVAGLKFLSKKSFNPQNLSNQKRVWEREQEQKLEEKRVRERQEQLKKEQSDDELALARGDTLKLNFLYKPPPGPDGVCLQHDRMTEDTTNESLLPEASVAESAEIAQRQPGDDNAAAAFRRLFAEPIKSDNGESVDMVNNPTFGTVLRGSNVEGNARSKDNRSTLEKSVGRKSSNVTLDEQIQRFPVLANAPRSKGVAQSSQVHFKPLGTQIRNVRCLTCGIWGHSKGDRECDQSGWDPFRVTQRGEVPRKHSSNEKVGAGKRERDDNSCGNDRSHRKSHRKSSKHRKSERRHRTRSRSSSPDQHRSMKRSRG